MLGAMACWVYYLDQHYTAEMANRERQEYAPDCVTEQQETARLSKFQVARMPHWLGCGPLAWRQALGAHGYLPSPYAIPLDSIRARIFASTHSR